MKKVSFKIFSQFTRKMLTTPEKVLILVLFFIFTLFSITLVDISAIEGFASADWDYAKRVGRGSFGLRYLDMYHISLFIIPFLYMLLIWIVSKDKYFIIGLLGTIFLFYAFEDPLYFYLQGRHPLGEPIGTYPGIGNGILWPKDSDVPAIPYILTKLIPGAILLILWAKKEII